MEINDTDLEIINDTTTTTALATGISLEDFKSFYYLINAKPDRETKFYHTERIVSKNNIEEINDLIQEKLSLHNIITSQTTVIVTLNNDRTLDFGNWLQFLNENWHTSAVTKSIVVVWDFSLQLHNYKFPQRHTVKLRIGSKLKPKDMFELMMNSDEDSQLMEAFAHTICSVDFINPVIGSELFLIVEKWHDALPKNQFTAKIHRPLRKYSGIIEKLIVFLVLISGVTILFALAKIYLENNWTEKFNQHFYLRIYGGLLASFLLLYVFYVFGKIWANKTLKYIGNLKQTALFNFTKGDENSTIELYRFNDKIIKSIQLKIIVTILFNVFAFVSSKIFDALSSIFK